MVLLYGHFVNAMLELYVILVCIFKFFFLYLGYVKSPTVWKLADVCVAFMSGKDFRNEQLTLKHEGMNHFINHLQNIFQVGHANYL